MRLTMATTVNMAITVTLNVYLLLLLCRAYVFLILGTCRFWYARTRTCYARGLKGVGSGMRATSRPSSQSTLSCLHHLWKFTYQNAINTHVTMANNNDSHSISFFLRSTTHIIYYIPKLDSRTKIWLILDTLSPILQIWLSSIPGTHNSSHLYENPFLISNAPPSIPGPSMHSCSLLENTHGWILQMAQNCLC